MGREYKIDIHSMTQAVAASGVEYTQPIPLTGSQGFFSMMVGVTGSGEVDLEYEVSNTETAPEVWVSPSGATSIATGLTAGNHFYPIELPAIALKMRLKITESGGTDPVSVILKVAIQ